MDLVEIIDSSDALRLVRPPSAMLAPEGPPPPDGGSSDMQLLGMVAAWTRHAAAVDRADTAQLDAEKRCLWPEVPDALFCRRSDHHMIRRYGHRHHSGRDWYGHRGVIDDLQRFLAESPFGRSVDPRECLMRDRADEIIGAAKAYNKAREAARVASGLDKAEAHADRLHERNRVLRRQIVQTRARSIAGVVAKAKLVRWCYGADLEEMTSALSDLLEGDGPTAEVVAISIAGDLVRLIDNIEITRRARVSATRRQRNVH